MWNELVADGGDSAVKRESSGRHATRDDRERCSPRQGGCGPLIGLSGTDGSRPLPGGRPTALGLGHGYAELGRLLNHGDAIQAVQLDRCACGVMRVHDLPIRGCEEPGNEPPCPTTLLAKPELRKPH